RTGPRNLRGRAAAPGVHLGSEPSSVSQPRTPRKPGFRRKWSIHSERDAAGHDETNRGAGAFGAFDRQLALDPLGTLFHSLKSKMPRLALLGHRCNHAGPVVLDRENQVVAISQVHTQATRAGMNAGIEDRFVTDPVDLVPHDGMHLAWLTIERALHGHGSRDD